MGWVVAALRLRSMCNVSPDGHAQDNEHAHKGAFGRLLGRIIVQRETISCSIYTAVYSLILPFLVQQDTAVSGWALVDTAVVC